MVPKMVIPMTVCLPLHLSYLQWYLTQAFGLNGKRSSRPLILNLTSPILMSMWAFVVLRKGLLRMSDTFESGCMSNTERS
jgi:hypothetical protein